MILGKVHGLVMIFDLHDDLVTILRFNTGYGRIHFFVQEYTDIFGTHTKTATSVLFPRFSVSDAQYTFITVVLESSVTHNSL